jgi:ubiquinone/menaquinone biosynthesis C-methylase UbiE
MARDAVKRKFDQRFYEERSWGSMPIKLGKDLPTLKLRYLLDLLDRQGTENVSLLEVGCGSGKILATIREHDQDIELTGVDVSEEQISLAARDNEGRNIGFVHGNGERLPFPDDCFDYVIFLDVIEHVDAPDAFMHEVVRVLKKGGYLYAFSPAEGHGIYRLSRRVFGRHFKEQACGHIQQFTIDGLLTIARRQKLEVQEKHYSYHLLGSLMDYTMFTLLLNERISRMFWSANKYYQTTQTRQSLASKVFNALLSFGNLIAFYESSALKNTRFTATGLHFVARK